MSCLSKATKKKEKEPGGLIKKDRTAELYRKLNKKPRPLWKSDWNKQEYNMEERRLAEDLSLMLNTALTVMNHDMGKDTLNAAEDCIRSLLKSMAILGYDEVADNKEH